MFNYTNEKKSIDIKLILVRKLITLKDFKLDGIISKKLLLIKNNSTINSNEKIIEIINNMKSNDSKYIKIDNSYYKQISFNLDYEIHKKLISDKTKEKYENKVYDNLSIGFTNIIMFGYGALFIGYGILSGILYTIIFGVSKIIEKESKPVFTLIKNTENNYLNEMTQLKNNLKTKK